MVFGAIVLSLVVIIVTLIYIIQVLRTSNEFTEKPTRRKKNVRR